jgi:hypothetical protein
MVGAELIEAVRRAQGEHFLSSLVMAGIPAIHVLAAKKGVDAPQQVRA